MRGRLDLARLLLDRGADVDAVGGDYGTALQAACARGYLDIAMPLRARGAVGPQEDEDQDQDEGEGEDNSTE